MAEESEAFRIIKGLTGTSNVPVQTKGNEPPQLPKGTSGTAPPSKPQPKTGKQ